MQWHPASEPVDAERAAIHYGLVLVYSPATGELGTLEPHVFQGFSMNPVVRSRVEWWTYLDEIPLPVKPEGGMVHGLGFRPEFYAPDFLARVELKQRASRERENEALRSAYFDGYSAGADEERGYWERGDATEGPQAAWENSATRLEIKRKQPEEG